MLPFSFFIYCHFVVDWIFQRKENAYAKLSDSYIRLRHSIIYGLIMSWLFMLVGTEKANTGWIGLSVTVYIVGTHFLFDTPSVKNWIALHTRGGGNPEVKIEDWWMLVLDQILHIGTLLPLYFLCK